MERATYVRVTQDRVECGVCARTLLTGERAESLVCPSGEEVIVCELCAAGARAAGWERGELDYLPPARRRRAPVVVRGSA